MIMFLLPPTTWCLCVKPKLSPSLIGMAAQIGRVHINTFCQCYGNGWTRKGHLVAVITTFCSNLPKRIQKKKSTSHFLANVSLMVLMMSQVNRLPASACQSPSPKCQLPAKSAKLIHRVINFSFPTTGLSATSASFSLVKSVAGFRKDIAFCKFSVSCLSVILHHNLYVSECYYLAIRIEVFCVSTGLLFSL